jgi:hypothetical protein
VVFIRIDKRLIRYYLCQSESDIKIIFSLKYYLIRQEQQQQQQQQQAGQYINRPKASKVTIK